MSGARELVDDLGDPVSLARPPERVVSLVPSLTESVALSAPELLCGATDWCSHPPALQVTRVRGTKNPNRDAIAGLRPDLVLANKEENRKADVDALRAMGIPVWVTVIETVDEAFRSLRRMFTQALRRPVPGWLHAGEQVWSEPATEHFTAAVAVWRDPWMVVGAGTFTGDLLTRLGARNVFGADTLPPAGRYPKVDVEAILARSPDVVVLPDEPYPFSAGDGPEAFPGRRIALVEGRSLTWYGPSLVTARRLLEQQLREARRSA